MHASRQLILRLFSQPWYRTLWTALLGLMNFIAPWFFIDQLEAQVVLGVFIVNSITMIALYALSGFTRLLGFANFLWIPLLYFLWTSLPDIPSTNSYGIWIRSLIGFNGFALLFNIIDVALYVRGDRKPLQ